MGLPRSAGARFWTVGALLWQIGCARPEAQFSGARGASLPPSRIVESRVLLPNHRVIGRVRVSCRNHEQGGGFFALLLDDSGCNVPALKRELRHVAAANGGELLVGADCDTDIEGRNDDAIVKLIHCEGDVARRGAPD
jgi:hypothetical protein